MLTRHFDLCPDELAIHMDLTARTEDAMADDMICIAAWIVEIIWSVSFHQLDCPQLIVSAV